MSYISKRGYRIKMGLWYLVLVEGWLTMNFGTIDRVLFRLVLVAQRAKPYYRSAKEAAAMPESSECLSIVITSNVNSICINTIHSRDINKR